jgi:peptide deformylase
VSVLPITFVGDPVLRRETTPVSRDELAQAQTQRFIDDLVETKRAANGAGLAANQVGDTRGIAVVEVQEKNPRYPYKPPYPLTLLVNPRIVSCSDERIEINEGCLSVPDLRGNLPRFVNVRVRYLDRDGNPQEEVRRGLTAGTFQHELDHLDGVLFVDRADPTTLATWDQFERHQRDEFVKRAEELVERVGS